MSKVNIAERKINIDKLLSKVKDKLLSEVKCNYLIMNRETLCDLDNAFGDWYASNYVPVVKKVNIQTHTHASIWGIPIAICEKLSYGEVEIV